MVVVHLITFVLPVIVIDIIIYDITIIMVVLIIIEAGETIDKVKYVEIN